MADLSLELAQKTSIWMMSDARDQRIIYYHAKVIQLGNTIAIAARLLVLTVQVRSR